MSVQLCLVHLFTQVARDVGLDPVTIEYCSNRIRCEGYKFLTVTLPKLSSSVLRSLELGYFDRTDLTCFRWKSRSLRYFRVFLTKIFCDISGKVLDSPDALAIKSLRQLCDYCYKLALPYSDEDTARAAEDFLADEAELSAPFDKNYVDMLRKNMETYMPYICRGHAYSVFQHSAPRAGSGTFSGKRRYPGKWYARKYFSDEFPSTLAAYSGYFRYAKSSPTPLVNVTDPDYSEVLFVPKDSRGPRTIVREPFTRLKAQMAYFDWITNKLESNTNIRFQDQLTNRSIALSSSVTREYATLDLKSASDRVRLDILLYLTRNCPAISYFLKNCRTATAKMPDGSFIKLRKVAGMGSGLTFPSMSLLIYLVATTSVAHKLRISFSKAERYVHVYGDDLIVPSTCAGDVMSDLQKVSLKCNLKKSFIHSHFRESCGGDYFNGTDVTPIRLKLTSSALDVAHDVLIIPDHSGLLQLERHSRELVKAGLNNTATYLYSKITKELRLLVRDKNYVLPYVGERSSALGRLSLKQGDFLYKSRCDSAGNILGVKAVVPVPVRDNEVSLDHYHVYGAKLRKNPKALKPWTYDMVELGSNETSVTIPRQLRLKVKKNFCPLAFS